MAPRVRYQPVWSDTFPASRRPAYPPFRGTIHADVVIVGGGLSGCAIAYSFASAGVKTILLEADRIGTGSTAGSSGLLRSDPAASFRDASARYGLRQARLLWQTTRRSALDFAAALRRLGIRVDPASAGSLTIARASKDLEKRLRREYDAQRDAGLEVSWLPASTLARESGVDLAVAGIRTRDGAQVDPYRAAIGLAAAAAKRGAGIFEKSAATRIRAGRSSVELRADGGTIAASAVVISTGYPPNDLRGLRRHFDRHLQYGVATEPMNAVMRRSVGRRAASVENVDAPTQTLRWTTDDRIVFCGGSAPFMPARSRAKAVEQHTWELMYRLSLLYPALSGIQPTHAWDLEAARTLDGLPYIGTHRNYPRHLFALGVDPHRLGYCWLAARLLLRQFQGSPEKADAVFGFARVL